MPTVSAVYKPHRSSAALHTVLWTATVAPVPYSYHLKTSAQAFYSTTSSLPRSCNTPWAYLVVMSLQYVWSVTTCGKPSCAHMYACCCGLKICAFHAAHIFLYRKMQKLQHPLVRPSAHTHVLPALHGKRVMDLDSPMKMQTARGASVTLVAPWPRSRCGSKICVVDVD